MVAKRVPFRIQFLREVTVSGTVVTAPAPAAWLRIYTDSARTALATVYQNETGTSVVPNDPLEADNTTAAVEGWLLPDRIYYLEDDQGNEWEMPAFLTPWTNVRKFGAVGDGTTDDTAAIQAAINAAAAAGGGGVVWFPAGTYLVTAVVSVPSGVRLVGESRYHTAIEYEGAADYLHFAIGSQHNGISDLYIDATNALRGILVGNPSSSVGAGYETDLTYRFRMENCMVQGPGPDVAGSIGLDLGSAHTSMLINNDVSDFRAIMKSTGGAKLTSIHNRWAQYRYGPDVTYGDAPAWHDAALFVNNEYLGPVVGNDGYGANFECSVVDIKPIYENNGGGVNIPTGGCHLRLGVVGPYVQIGGVFSYRTSTGEVLDNAIKFVNGWSNVTFIGSHLNSALTSSFAGSPHASQGPATVTLVACDEALWDSITASAAGKGYARRDGVDGYGSYKANNSLRVPSTADPVTGPAAVELVYTGGEGYLLAVDRDSAGALDPMNIYGETVKLHGGAATGSAVLAGTFTSKGLTFTGTGATASGTDNFVTVNGQAGVVTTKTLYTAAGATYTFTINNNVVVAGSRVLAMAWLGGATTGIPLVTNITPGSGTVAVDVTNIGAAGFNGSIKIGFLVIQA